MNILFFDFVDSVEIAHKAVEVKAIPDDKLFGYLMSDLVRFGILVLKFGGFEEHRSDLDGSSTMRPHMCFELMDCEARIHDILNDDNVSLVHHLLEGHDEFQLAGSSHAKIGTDADKSLFASHVFEPANKVRRKDEGAIEDHDKEGFLVFIIGTNLVRHLLYIRSDLFRC